MWQKPNYGVKRNWAFKCCGKWVEEWKKPSAITKQRLADYFGVSVSELTGEEQKEKPAPGGSELDARFDELLSQMTDADRADLLEYMEFKVAKRKENPNG